MNELSKGTKGSIAEYRVGLHLLGLGFQVFKNLSVNGPCDLIAVRGRRALRVQVKSTLGLGQLRNLRNGGNDLLAVLVDGEIRYRAVNRRVQAMVPGSILARRPKRHKQIQVKRHGRATAAATKVVAAWKMLV